MSALLDNRRVHNENEHTRETFNTWEDSNLNLKENLLRGLYS